MRGMAEAALAFVISEKSLLKKKIKKAESGWMKLSQGPTQQVCKIL